MSKQIYSNVEQLINDAILISDEKERLQFVLEYFYKTVEYDYSYLFVKGYTQGNISMFNNKYDYIDNPLKKGSIKLSIDNQETTYDDSISRRIVPVKGKSELFDKIVLAPNNSEGDYSKYISKIKEIYRNAINEHLGNQKITEETINKIISVIEANKRVGILKEINGERYFIADDISVLLCKIMIEPEKYFPPVIENGLLKSGVCQHFADYLTDLLPKVGLRAVRIDGTSVMGHAWNAVSVNGEYVSVDLTRAIFIRDNWIGIPKEQKYSDWLISDFADTFAMQPTRSIKEIGKDENNKMIPIPKIINSETYDKKILFGLLKSSPQKQPIIENNNHKIR